MATNLNTGLNFGLNPGLRQSISGGVDNLGLFRSASLDLRFADKKTLTDRVSGNNLITFSRASSGTYVESDGLIKTAAADTPRFDHDPATGESLGLLIEEERTNLLINSTNPNIGRTGANQPTVTTSPNQVLPDGQIGTVKLIAFAASLSRARLKVPGSFAGTFTGSYYWKLKNGGTWAREFANALTASNTLYTEIKCSLLGIPEGSEIYVTFGQIEEGSFPTSYIPSTNSAVTRSPDLVTIEGTNFTGGGWYNQSEGTIFSDISPLDADSDRAYLFSNGTDAQRLGQNTESTSTFALFMNKEGTTSLATAVSGMPKPIKACLAYKPGSSRGAIDGELKTLSTTSNVPNSINQIGLGSQSHGSGGGFLNGHIARFSYFPTRKADSDLVKMTS